MKKAYKIVITTSMEAESIDEVSAAIARWIPYPQNYRVDEISETESILEPFLIKE